MQWNTSLFADRLSISAKLAHVLSGVVLVCCSAQTAIFTFQQFFGYSAIKGTVFGSIVSTLLLGLASMFFFRFRSRAAQIHFDFALAFALWLLLLGAFSNSAMDSQSAGFKFAGAVVGWCCR